MLTAPCFALSWALGELCTLHESWPEPGLVVGVKLSETAELGSEAGPIKGAGQGSQPRGKGQPAHGFLGARTQSAHLVSSFASAPFVCFALEQFTQHSPPSLLSWSPLAKAR